MLCFLLPFIYKNVISFVNKLHSGHILRKQNSFILYSEGTIISIMQHFTQFSRIVSSTVLLFWSWMWVWPERFTVVPPTWQRSPVQTPLGQSFWRSTLKRKWENNVLMINSILWLDFGYIDISIFVTKMWFQSAFNAATWRSSQVLVPLYSISPIPNMCKFRF